MKRYRSIFQRPNLTQEILQNDNKYNFTILFLISDIKCNKRKSFWFNLIDSDDESSVKSYSVLSTGKLQIKYPTGYKVLNIVHAIYK